MNDNQQNLGKLLKVFNADRIISPDEIQEIFSGIIGILSENKKGVESLNEETKKQLGDTLKTLTQAHNELLKGVKSDLSTTQKAIEKLTKETNNRAFANLQEIIKGIRMPEDGKDADPADVVPLVLEQIVLPESQTIEAIRDGFEAFEGDERLDASAIKGLPDYIKAAKKAGKSMPVGGIRFFENLADVSVPITTKRADLLAQYNTTNNRWENGVAITVSTTAPTSPATNDVWIDCS